MTSKSALKASNIEHNSSSESKGKTADTGFKALTILERTAKLFIGLSTPLFCLTLSSVSRHTNNLSPKLEA